MVYVSNNQSVADSFKNALSRRFKMRDLSPLRYFLGVEVACSTIGISISSKKACNGVIGKDMLLGM